MLQQTSQAEYDHLKHTACPREKLERAVPQHTANGDAHPDWIAARQNDPNEPAGPRPINSSDALIIFKNKDYTYDDLNVLLKYHQRKGMRKEFSEQLKQIMKWGTVHEEDGCATALRYILDGTNGWAEQVGLLRLSDDLSFVACSPDMVLHLQTCDGWKEIPLEIKCPTQKFGNKFDGRMKVKHLLQVHIQMKALRSDYAYLCYWTPEAGYLYKVTFDDELWALMEEGIKTWRDAVVTGATKAPQSPADKALRKSVWTRCEKLYTDILSNGDYTTLPSCVARAGK